MQTKKKGVVRSILGSAIVAAILGVVAASSAAAQQTADAVAANQGADAQAKHDWRESIKHSLPQEEGCFHTTYPSLHWTKVACGPATAYRSAHPLVTQQIGNSYDYVAEAATSHDFSSVTGSFPTVSGLTSESTVNVPFGDGESSGITGSNEYTLQLNTNLDSGSAACKNGTVSSACAAWTQFIVTSNYVSLNGDETNETAAFVEYWLINYGGSLQQFDAEYLGQNDCPNGLEVGGIDTNGIDCVENTNPTVISPSVLPITDLTNITLSGTVAEGGSDIAIATYETKSAGGVPTLEAYASSYSDSANDIASGWNQAEFNVVGNDNGSEASFNNGTSLTVQLSVDDGTTAAPTCGGPGTGPGEGGPGTTGESNNLSFAGGCTGYKGTTDGSTVSTSGGTATLSSTNPYIEFEESN